MKRFDALLVGYYGMHNTGDDMLMAAAAAGARRHLMANNIAATAARGSDVCHALNVSAIQSKNQKFRGHDRILKYIAAAHSRHIVIGGGSVFHTAKDIRQKLQYLKLAGNNKHSAVGVGLGPFVDSEAERVCTEFLDRCDFTGLRDRVSFDIARSIAPNANVALTFDLAPGMSVEPDFVSALAPNRDNAIGVALCPVERFSGDENAELHRNSVIANTLNKLYKQEAFEVRLIDFNGHPDLGDHPVHQDLRQKLKNIPCEIIHYAADPMRAVNQISRLRGILAMRLHAAVFAYLSGTPAIVLNYHPKCHNWCRDIGQSEDFSMDTVDIDGVKLETSLARILADDYIFPQLPISAAAEKAMSNWSSY
jgi:polysaccharide pyruvyl transferase WcaK-like protein